MLLRNLFFFFFSIVVLAGCSVKEGEEKTRERPNVIVVITDDQGYGDLGCHGNPYIRTPHLDQFCNEAVSFTNFHVSTTCAPTRGALMTGRHTNRLNVYHTISGRSLLYEDEVILPQILGDNGYVCGMFGKWHLGDNYPFRPADRGFDDVVRHGGGGICQLPDYWGNDYFDDTYWHNGEMQQYEGYCTDVFFNEAIRFIEEHQKEPFFCYLSTNAPHGPLNVPVEYMELYREVKEVPERLKRFYGMITNIDDNFNRLQEHLERLGLTDNTILIFMTDNGTAGGHVVYDAGLRGHKGSEYEGGHRVPFMWRWPGGNIGGGLKVGQLTAHFDLLPTLVDLLDLDFEPAKPLDGVSLEPLLSGQTENWPNRVLYVDTQRRLNLVKYKQYSVMDNNWRLVNGKELYNVSDDLGQTRNLIDTYPEVSARLAEEYELWWQSILEEGVEDRYAYIKAGSPRENPVRICSHDMISPLPGFWHQYGAANASEGSGVWKVEIVEQGEYRISLRRFPRESGMGFNAQFPAAERAPRLHQSMPASNNVGFVTASLSMANFSKIAPIAAEAEEVSFHMKLPEGKFDMVAQLHDREGRCYPSYFVYIEKLDE
ncbi:MAG: arylsulfatase [Bacteroidales bacterium]|nr:arylsulfatase [Bacteroidales bacterium]